jgi:hypothetical protein
MFEKQDSEKIMLNSQIAVSGPVPVNWRQSFAIHFWEKEVRFL